MTRIKTAQIPLVKAQLLKRQEGKCPCCTKGITVAEACLDHDHYTGLIRGALCRNCNGIEGKLKNLATRGRRLLSSKQYVANIVRYWIKHESDQTGLYHPTHLTDDEKRIKRNAKARKTRAAKKKAVK